MDKFRIWWLIGRIGEALLYIGTPLALLLVDEPALAVAPLFVGFLLVGVACIGLHAGRPRRPDWV